MKNSKHQHFKIYKPFGYLSQFVNNDVSKHKKKLLGELYNFPNNTMAIGRLDEKSEGLLLLTTDGQMSEFFRGKSIEKEYFVQIDGDISQLEIEQLKKGVEIGFEGKRYVTKPCKVSNLLEIPKLPIRGKKIRDNRHGPTSWLSIIITEGKFRQVRKMTAAIGFPTLRLVRMRVGDITLNNMKAGEVIALKELIN